MLVFKYSLFAAFSILVNLAFQYLSSVVYTGPLAFYVALCAGTGAGLLVKYVLDKCWIFYHTDDLKGDAKNFVLYSLMGVATTVIFWGSEITFEYMVPIEGSRYVGGGLGLVVGYWVKYHLDKKFVFRKQACN